MKRRNLKRRILALATCTLVLIGALMLPIGAEVTPPTPPTFDSSTIYDYPGANLLPYPYSTFASSPTDTVNGITYEMRDYGLVVAGGTSTAYSYKYLYVGPFPAGTYTVSGGDSIVRLVADVYVDGRFSHTAMNSSFVVPENGSLSVYVAVNANKTVDTVVYPMVSLGSTPYPYQPYLPYYFQQAFDDGYLNGYDIGQKDGYDNAISKMEEKSKSIFDKATFEYEIKSSEYKFDKATFTPNKLHSSVWFNNLTTQIENQLSNVDPYWDYVDYVNIIISWEEEKTFDYQMLQLYIAGDFDVGYGKITTIDGKSYNLNADQGTSSTKRKFVPETESTSQMLVKSITIRVGRPSDLLSEFTLYAPDESYNNGYTDGYKTGYNEAEQGVTHTTYNKGYKDGFSKGKEEGIKLSETGNWRELITSVVDVPSTIFMNLFNFEILGMDMRVAFGSLMALCVIAIILKFTLLR